MDQKACKVYPSLYIEIDINLIHYNENVTSSEVPEEIWTSEKVASFQPCLKFEQPKHVLRAKENNIVLENAELKKSGGSRQLKGGSFLWVGNWLENSR
jgi:hypothetical protein